MIIQPGNYYENLFSEDCVGNIFSEDYETTNSELADKTAEASNMEQKVSLVHTSQARVGHHAGHYGGD